MRKLVVVSIITILSVYGFSMAVSVGIGFNLDMSSGALVTPVFIQFSAGIPYLRGRSMRTFFFRLVQPRCQRLQFA